MLNSILGTKIGMTEIYDESGNTIPVTVVAAGPCVVMNIRTKEKNGYTAVQLAFGDGVREKSLPKPLAGQFTKRNIPLKKNIREFRLGDVSGFQVGQEVKADIFKAGDYVDVTGTTKGHGFSGTVKRHGFAGGPSTHGQSDRQRAPGSIGGQGPQRVLRGMRMAGHYGVDTVTVQKLKVVLVDPEKNIMLIRGAVPGVNKGLLVIEKTKKKLPAPVAPKADKKKTAKAKK